MNKDTINSMINECINQSLNSKCARRKFGALLLDPVTGRILSTGFNHHDNDGPYCGGDTCFRNECNVPSGTQVEIGCIHAEMDLLTTCASKGVRTKNMWMFVSGEPCLMCAKLIVNAGVSCVVVVDKGYAGANGVHFLEKHGIEVKRVDGPKDKRLSTNSL